MDIVTYALAKGYTEKTLSGMGALKGSPCKIKSVVPVYSPIDPAVVIKNIITLEWDSNQTPGGAPELHQEQIEVLDNGRGIKSVVWDHTDTSNHWFKITFYDNSTEDFFIPLQSAPMKKRQVATLPSPAIAEDNTIYIVDDQQFVRVLNEAGQYEMLNLGGVSIDLSAYQTRLDPNLGKDYPTFDPQNPTGPSISGAIVEHEKSIGGNYDYDNNIISNLTTYHKGTLVDAINDMGNLEDLDMWDGTSPITLVDAINQCGGAMGDGGDI